MIDEQEVVLLNLVTHQEEDESEKCANRHRDWKNQRHWHNGEGEGLVVAQLEEPVICVGPVPDPVEYLEEALVEEVRYIKHLNAVCDKDNLHEIACNESCHVANIARDEPQELVEGVFFDELDDLLVCDQTGQR